MDIASIQSNNFVGGELVSPVSMRALYSKHNKF